MFLLFHYFFSLLFTAFYTLDLQFLLLKYQGLIANCSVHMNSTILASQKPQWKQTLCLRVCVCVCLSSCECICLIWTHAESNTEWQHKKKNGNKRKYYVYSLCECFSFACMCFYSNRFSTSFFSFIYFLIWMFESSLLMYWFNISHGLQFQIHAGKWSFLNASLSIF